MAKATDQEKPDYDKFTTVEEVDEEITRQKDTICKLVKNRGVIRDHKKEAVSAYNEQLKEIEEELEHGTAVIDELTRHKRIITSGKHLRTVK